MTTFPSALKPGALSWYRSRTAPGGRAPSATSPRAHAWTSRAPVRRQRSRPASDALSVTPASAISWTCATTRPPARTDQAFRTRFR